MYFSLTVNFHFASVYFPAFYSCEICVKFACDVHVKAFSCPIDEELITLIYF